MGLPSEVLPNRKVESELSHAVSKEASAYRAGTSVVRTFRPRHRVPPVNLPCSGRRYHSDVTLFYGILVCFSLFLQSYVLLMNMHIYLYIILS